MANSNKKRRMTIGYINVYNQGGLDLGKQLEIEQHVRDYRLDVVHLQEINMSGEVFRDCPYLTSSFAFLANLNSPTGFGTASLVKNSFAVDGFRCDKEGRVICFELDDWLTCWNVYLQCGQKRDANNSREEYCGKILPQLLLNRKPNGIGGGDYNCVTDKLRDAPVTSVGSCANLIKLNSQLEASDCYRSLHPRGTAFSRPCNGNGSRIDRSYYYGEDIEVVSAEYIPLRFSDHRMHVVTIEVPQSPSGTSTKTKRAYFKIRPEVIMDSTFQDHIRMTSNRWTEYNNRGYPIMDLWEDVIKKDVKRLALQRSKALNYKKIGA